MVTRVSAEAGFDPRYMLRGLAEPGQPEKTAGGYYLSAAQAGEAPGRWFGWGAELLGFAAGQKVDADPFLKVYQQVHPVTGEQMGRKPGNYAKYRDLLAEMEVAEPYATAERKVELAREAAQKARRSPAYTDTTASHDKTISIVHAAIRENGRRAALAGDLEAAAIWHAREQRWQEILQEGNRRGLEYMQEMAGWTRTGYHGKRAGGVEPGRWERALPVVTTWLQGTNRKGEPHDHSHNVWARMAVTESDGKWRALDTMRIRGHLGGMSAVVSAYVESALTQEFGVAWVARPDGMGNEIKGVMQEWKDAFSTRTQAVNAEARKRAAEFEAEHRRKPNAREMLFIRHAARDHSRTAKDDVPIDWKAKTREWDAAIGGRLAGLTDTTLGCVPPGEGDAPGPPAQQRVIKSALARVQREHSTWTKADLMKAVGWSMGPEFARMAPDARQAMLFTLTGQALGVEHGVKCLEAPEWPPVPQALRRGLDGRSVYTAPGTERYATHGQLSLEDGLLQRAQRHGAPCLAREDVAAQLGADADTLEAVLHARTQDATQRTLTGLRYDQASMIFEAFTSGRRGSVGVGPAGSGKTHTVGEGARVWQALGGHVVGITTSQAARNVLEQAGIRDAWNSTRWLAQMNRPGTKLPPGTLVVVDEGSTVGMRHMDAIFKVAERDNAKVLITGDHRQLAAVDAGGAMNLLAGHLGYTQLAVPVRFTAGWEQQASLRLREGDKGALEAYDEHGRITGGTRARVFEEARKAYVAGRLAGEDVLLMAYTRENCRELSRIIRDDLVHLGLVDGGRSVRLAEGARASAGDLIVARKNDHQLTTDPGHTLANGDIFRVDKVTERGLVVRRILEADPGSGAMRLAGHDVLYPPEKFTTTDLAYAVTGHNGQGGTVARGEAVFTGGESREWSYVALTRGRERNTARVITQQRATDPRPGTLPDPELDRHDLLQAERDGLPHPPAKQDPNLREAIGVLADCLEREDGEDSATEYERKSLVRADHLGLLHARWLDQVKDADHGRYRQLVEDALPEEWRGQLSPQATWMYRTMKAAELAGLDPAEVAQTAIRSRTLDGARDLASVLDARMRAMTGPLVPQPQKPWTERVPQLADSGRQQYLQRLAEAMDARKERIGEHTAEAQPEWALRALGAVPEDPAARLDWQRRASAIGAYRELYGIEDEADLLGPEPAGSSPDQRPAWREGFAALTRTDTVDLRSLPEESLWHMRSTYKSETEWAPPHTGRQLRGVRLAAEDARQLGIRSAAEATAAADPQTADRHAAIAASARALAGAYRTMEEPLAAAMEDRQAWDKLTAAPRRLAVAADSELRRRNPDAVIEPLRSAEPAVPEDASITPTEQDGGHMEPPDWIAHMDAQREAFQEKLGQRQQVMVPDEDPDWGFLGQAWPGAHQDPDQIVQPPKPEIPASPRVLEHAAQRETGDREAGA